MIGFVILTWNSEKCIIRCLEAINAIKEFQCDVVVVDNGSTDKTIELIENFTEEVKSRSEKSHHEWKLVKLQENKGTTVSRNIGIKALNNDCSYICILDSDAYINEEAIRKMIGVLTSNKKNGIVGPCMKNLDGIVQNSGRKIPSLKIKLFKILPIRKFRELGEQYEYYNYPKDVSIYPVGYLMSACWLIKTEVTENIGCLDEKIFYAPEDVEYCLRAWKNGYRIMYCKDAEIIHEWQRLSRKKLFSRHNWEHIKGLVYMFCKYRYCFNTDKLEKYVQ